MGPNGTRAAGRLAVIGLLVAVMLLLPGRTEQAGAQANPDAVRTLATRLLVPSVSGPNGMTQSAELLPGAVPGDLPFALPQPPGANLLGSVVRRFGGTPLNWEVLFDSPSSRDDLVNYYAQALAAQGWMAPPARSVGGRGFAPGGQVDATPGTFCRGANGPYLAVSANPTGGGPTDLRVFISAEAGGLCNAASSGAGAGPFDRVPALAAPAGVAVANPNGFVGASKVTTEAVATTTATAVDLDAAYGAQLAAAGWTKTAGGASGPVAWSTWTVPGDGNFTGYLTVREVPGGNVRDLHLSVASPAAANTMP